MYFTARQRLRLRAGCAQRAPTLDVQARLSAGPQGQRRRTAASPSSVTGCFMVTPDANLVALDARTGKLLWQTEMAEYQQRPVHSDAGAARRQGQGDRRHRRRGVRHPRLHRCLRRRDRQARLALLDGARQGRTGRRHVAGRFLEARRRLHLDDRHLRSRAQHALLGRRQSRARTCTATRARATTSTPARWWRSIRTPAS